MNEFSYPPADREDIVDRLHGHYVADPYRRLEDQADLRTRRWLAAQDELWQTHLAGLPGRERWRARCAELADVGMISAPMWRGERRFFLRRSTGQEHPVLFADDDVLIDPSALDPQGSTTLDTWQPDLEGGLVAFQLSRNGTERSQLSVIDVETRRIVDGPVDRCRYSPVAWLPGGEAFFYVRALGGASYPQQVLLHRVGAPAESDVPVFGAGGERTSSFGLGISPDGRWLAVSSSPGLVPRNDLWLADLRASAPQRPEFRLVHDSADGRAVCVVGRDGVLYVVTDREAPRVRMCVADPTCPDVWRELIPQDPDAILADFAILDGPELDRRVLLVALLRQSTAELAIHDLATGRRVGKVPLPGTGSIGPLSTRLENAHEVWFTYTDTTTPLSVWRYDQRTGATTQWAAAPGGVVTSEVENRQITCASADGSPVLVRILGRSFDGPRPTILYGYGGFGIPMLPNFAADALAWVEAGGILAIAHVRGGGEHGLTSHRAGMLGNKQRVFDDFIAAAQMLIAAGFTTPEQLTIWGESNGGLLVGAALTQRPDLFAAAVCIAPLLDMVRYEKSGLGPAWRGEYGSVEDPEQLDWLLAYSPYHQVREKVAYPAVLFAVFGGDSRVDPLHARKMCAALQWASTSGRPVVLRHEDGVGHSARSADRSVAAAADMLAFLAAHSGLRVD